MFTLQEFKKFFKYKLDDRDTWRILSPSNPIGDCDDFVATILYIETGSMLKWWWWLFIRRAKLIFVSDPNGKSHIVLWVRDKGYIDTWYQNWGPEMKHTVRRRAAIPVIARKMLLGLIYN